MALTKRFSRFHKEAEAFKIFLTQRAVKTLGVVVAVERLHPPVPSFNGETASNALGGEQLVPIFLAVWEAVLQVEGEVGEDLAAVGTAEALGVPGGAQRLQTVPQDLPAALAAIWRKEGSITVLTVQFSFFLHKSHILERLPAALHVADKVVGAPGPAQCSDEGASFLLVDLPIAGDAPCLGRDWEDPGLCGPDAGAGDSDLGNVAAGLTVAGLGLILTP